MSRPNNNEKVNTRVVENPPFRFRNPMLENRKWEAIEATDKSEFKPVCMQCDQYVTGVFTGLQYSTDPTKHSFMCVRCAESNLFIVPLGIDDTKGKQDMGRPRKVRDEEDEDDEKPKKKSAVASKPSKKRVVDEDDDDDDEDEDDDEEDEKPAKRPAKKSSKSNDDDDDEDDDDDDEDEKVTVAPAAKDKEEKRKIKSGADLKKMVDEDSKKAPKLGDAATKADVSEIMESSLSEVHSKLADLEALLLKLLKSSGVSSESKAKSKSKPAKADDDDEDEDEDDGPKPKKKPGRPKKVVADEEDDDDEDEKPKKKKSGKSAQDEVSEKIEAYLQGKGGKVHIDKITNWLLAKGYLTNVDDDIKEDPKKFRKAVKGMLNDLGFETNADWEVQSNDN